ncbi:protein FAR1-RELATED SEQUENCE 4-like [Rutidosis leptorrhynchoides]|uniref:protein FAR1-RELATED SEQUENCE 4-like n=1 Tax=Rutidosis leptorrhynchoides TaxID=125765 RepID=UPI003A98EF17
MKLNIQITCVICFPLNYNTPTTTTTRKNETPGGSSYYAPIVDKSFLPVIGNNYETLDQREEMYRLYAYNACFDIRKAGQKTAKSGAKVRFEWVYGTNSFFLVDFEEQHNHELLLIEYRHLSKKKRQMRYAEQLFIYHSTVSNIGPTKEYEVYSNMKGSEKMFMELTNRYNLKFVLFTTIDNHRRCVTVVAGIIRDETAESYTCLLNCFMKTFGKEPNMIVTDHDKAMVIAIKEIQEANPNIENGKEKDFKKRFDKIVWNMYIEPTVFEEKWEKLMDDFSLKNGSWFKHMFNIRSSWIPAYFIETGMFGLMRTTSRSENENAFFTLYKICIKSVNFYGRL